MQVLPSRRLPDSCTPLHNGAFLPGWLPALVVAVAVLRSGSTVRRDRRRRSGRRDRRRAVAGSDLDLFLGRSTTAGSARALRLLCGASGAAVSAAIRPCLRSCVRGRTPSAPRQHMRSAPRSMASPRNLIFAGRIRSVPGPVAIWAFSWLRRPLSSGARKGCPGLPITASACFYVTDRIVCTFFAAAVEGDAASRPARHDDPTTSSLDGAAPSCPARPS